jgi:ribosomal-protein-alanine N-acetyltransferase
MKNIPKNYVIQTERLFLRIPSRGDYSRIFSATRYQGFNEGMPWEPPESLEELEGPLQRSLHSWEKGEGYSFTIEYQDQPGLCGRISIRKTDEERVWNVGFWTHPELQREGIMTEALGGVLIFGFNELHAIRIEACFAVWNEASKRVLEKNKFKYVSHIPKGFMKKGKWVAEDLMAIDLVEWENSLNSPANTYL